MLRVYQRKSTGSFTKHEWSFFERFHFYTRREGPQVMCSPSSMAIRPNDRKWFFRLHNFNSNSDYYINPVDGIKTNLAPSWQTATFEGPSVPVETRERELNSGSMESNKANSKWVSSGSWKWPGRGAGVWMVFEQKEEKNGNCEL